MGFLCIRLREMGARCARKWHLAFPHLLEEGWVAVKEDREH